MSEPAAEVRREQGPDSVPVTGHPAVDQAVGALADLDSLPLTEHPERMAQAHELLHAELQDRPNDGA